MSLLLLCICQGPSSMFQSSGSYQHVKRGVLNHESSACSLWTPALSGIQKGLGSWEVHSQSSIWMPPLPVSPHDPVLLYASTHSASSVPVLSSCSDLSSCCQFCSPHWTGHCAFAGIQADTSVSGAVPGAVQTVGAGTSQRAGSEAMSAFLTGVRMGFCSTLN